MSFKVSFSFLLESLPNSRCSAIPRVLVLMGPSGCAKSTTVEVLAKELGVSVQHVSVESIMDDLSLPQTEFSSGGYTNRVSQRVRLNN